MKRYYFILSFFVAVVLIAASCEDIEPAISIPENEFAIDIDNFVNASFFDIIGTEKVKLSAKSPFLVTILSNGDYAVSKDDIALGNFVISPNEIPQSRYRGENLSLTRDLTLYVLSLELQTISGFGYFQYPIRVRQRGADGTVYLTAEDIRAWQEDHSSSSSWGGDANQRYILGTITKVGDMHTENGVYDGIAYCGELWQVPATQRSYPEPQILDAVDIEINVDGATLMAKVHYPACYKLVSKNNYKVGDRIEMNIPNSGIITGNNTLWVSPQDILIVK